MAAGKRSHDEITASIEEGKRQARAAADATGAAVLARNLAHLASFEDTRDEVCYPAWMEADYS